LLLTTAASCSDSQPAASEDDLTSVSARSRKLVFEGYVYARADASDSDILYQIRRQTQTAFGALRTAEVGVNSRELKDVDPTSFAKEEVQVVDPAAPDAPAETMLRVTYRYEDDAVVPKSMADRSALSLAVMAPGYTSQIDRVLHECTLNDSEAQEFRSSIWYVFDPSLSSCQQAIADEQRAIDEASDGLGDASTQIVRQELERLYIPITVSLGADQTNDGKSWPEYDRLYRGGVQPNKLVVSLVNGFIDHGSTDYTDSGYGEWLEELRESFRSHPDFHLANIDPPEDLSTYDVNGTEVSGVGFDDIMRWELDYGSVPDGLSWSDRDELRRQAGEKLIKHWLTFESTVKVSIGGAPAEEVTLTILTYFGTDSSSVPHKQAIKNSDVFIYNGHSYIGYGPLDPTNFSADDFPSSYQILFIDGCVSYNYYEKDYVPLKEGGTKNLDLITNGLEAPAWRSGYALGRFVSTLLDGKQASYRDLLSAAKATDALRVVDGELDNAFDPNDVPIVVE
jgi:hypothetical protein